MYLLDDKRAPGQFWQGLQELANRHIGQ